MYIRLWIPVMLWAGILSAPQIVQADWCFCWQNDGSASDGVPDEGNDGNCDTECAGYDQKRPLPGDLEMEGPDDGLPSTYDGPAEEGQDWCICWNDDGSGSQTVPDAGNDGGCTSECEDWDHNIHVPRDSDGKVRWRYVVVVGGDEGHEDPDCDDTGNPCREWHRLYKCGKDETIN